MTAPNPSIQDRQTEVLAAVRHLLSQNPVAELGPEAIAGRLGVPPWSVELALEVLRLEDGEVVG